MADVTDVTVPTRRMSSLTRRSRLRRAGESAYGLLLLGRQLVLVALVLLIVAAGVRASWGTAGWAAARDGRGTMRVTHCSTDECTGSFTPSGAGGTPRERVVLGDSAGTHEGDRVSVALRADTTQVVRTGTSGLLRACLPLGGALVLAAVVVAGGLRMRRTAWVLGVAAVALLVGVFVTS